MPGEFPRDPPFATSTVCRLRQSSRMTQHGSPSRSRAGERDGERPRAADPARRHGGRGRTRSPYARDAGARPEPALRGPRGGRAAAYERLEGAPVAGDAAAEEARRRALHEERGAHRRPVDDLEAVRPTARTIASATRSGGI